MNTRQGMARIIRWSVLFSMLLAVTSSQYYEDGVEEGDEDGNVDAYEDGYEDEDVAVMPLTPTIVAPEKTNFTADAEELMNALNTDIFLDTALSLFTRRTSEQRENIIYQINRLYGNEALYSVLVPLATDEFGEAMSAVLSSTAKFYSIVLNEALDNNDENTILETLLCMDGPTRNATFQEYESQYRATFMDNFNKLNTTTDAFRAIVYILCNERDESSTVNQEITESVAKVLSGILESPEEANLTLLNSILLETNAAQIRAINREYVRLTGHTIRSAVNDKFPEDDGDAYDIIVRFIVHPQKYLAERLNDAINDEEPDLATINRIIIGRSEIDLGNIIRHYSDQYSSPLSVDLATITDGQYQKLLRNFLGNFVNS